MSQVRSSVTVTIVALVCAALSGCGASTDSGGSSEESGDVAEAGSAEESGDVAEAALLQLSDFPEGWIGEPLPDDGLSSDTAGPVGEYAFCVGSETFDVLDLGGGRAVSDEFFSPNGSTLVWQTVSVSDEESAADLMRRFDQADTECIADANRELMTAAGVELDSVDVQQIDFESEADETVLLRTFVSGSTGQDGPESWTLDLLLQRVDNGVSAVYPSSEAPMAPEEMEQLADAVVRRMSDAL